MDVGDAVVGGRRLRYDLGEVSADLTDRTNVMSSQGGCRIDGALPLLRLLPGWPCLMLGNCKFPSFGVDWIE